jgi:hypothetical protein
MQFAVVEVSKMNYMKLLSALAALFLLAGFALAIQNEDSLSPKAGECNESCVGSCQNHGACTGQSCQLAEPCQNKSCNIALLSR